MRLRFDEGEGESHIDNNNNDTSNYTSYYDCAHNKEVEEEEVHDNGDKSPLLPSVAQYDNICKDHHNDSDIDYDTENHNNIFFLLYISREPRSIFFDTVFNFFGCFFREKHFPEIKRKLMKIMSF